jgi:hypothetical protein
MPTAVTAARIASVNRIETVGSSVSDADYSERGTTRQGAAVDPPMGAS